MKHYLYKGLTTSCVLAMLMLITSGILTSCKNQSAPPSIDLPKGEEGKFNAMKAPEIDADDNGIISLSECPTENERIKVVVSEEKDTVIISVDGKEIQTLTDEDERFVAADDDTPVYFLDANFDGWVDIFIGPGVSRTYSSLLLWNPTDNKFERVGSLGSPTLQNFMMCPSDKSVYEGGSSSWCSYYFERKTWKDNNLEKQEAVTVVLDANEYGSNGVENKYTLKDANEKLIVSTDDATELPGLWNILVGEF